MFCIKQTPGQESNVAGQDAYCASPRQKLARPMPKIAEGGT
jgi:hypothetical protein